MSRKSYWIGYIKKSADRIGYQKDPDVQSSQVIQKFLK